MSLGFIHNCFAFAIVLFILFDSFKSKFISICHDISNYFIMLQYWHTEGTSAAAALDVSSWDSAAEADLDAAAAVGGTEVVSKATASQVAMVAAVALV